MRLIRVLPFATVAVFLSATAVARADIAPASPDTCTLQAQQQSGRQCQLCGASYEQPQKCQALASQGYAQACRSGGASVWHEVWCRGGGDVPPAEKKSGCGACSVGGSHESGMPLALALATMGALALCARRRR